MVAAVQASGRPELKATHQKARFTGNRERSRLAPAVQLSGASAACRLCLKSRRKLLSGARKLACGKIGEADDHGD